MTVWGEDTLLNNFVSVDTSSEKALWRQIYDSIAFALSDGIIDEGSRIPSIRELAKELSVSRSPVENAYIKLQIDGYIESRPKSGFFVATSARGERDEYKMGEAQLHIPVEYDFGSGSVDSGAADITMWRKHLRTALGKQQEIISQGDPQGEPALRRALVGYSLTSRGVVASPERIVVASGTQQLLASLCRVLGRGRAAIETPGFVQGEQIFSDFGWNIEKIERDNDTLKEKLDRSECELFADITSNMPQTSLHKLAGRRAALLAWAEQKNKYILEDDYNGELRYVSRTVPALQGKSQEKVIYIGSFSRLLLPSVRIAYMVLPAELAERAVSDTRLYNQTSSKIEQLALAEYITGGCLERHIKRSRKVYRAKAAEILSAVSSVFGKGASAVLYETSISVSITLNLPVSEESALRSASEHGIVVERISRSENGKTKVSLSFAGIAFEKIRPGIEKLKEVWRI